MADLTVHEQKFKKKVIFSDDPGKHHTNKSKVGPNSKGQLEKLHYITESKEGPHITKSKEGPSNIEQAVGNCHNQNTRGPYKHQFAEGPLNSPHRFRDQQSIRNRNQSDFLPEKAHALHKPHYKSKGQFENAYHDEKGGPSQNRRSETEHFYHESNNRSRNNDIINKGLSDFGGLYSGKNRGDYPMRNASREYESINRNPSNPSPLQRSRSFGQSGVGKAMENFGVRDLRELLNKKHGNREDMESAFDKTVVPPKDPEYNYLKDPLRENAQENPTNNERRNKNHPNQALYQPVKNKTYENMPNMNIKDNQPIKNEGNRSHRKPKYNQTIIETMKDLPNIKVQLNIGDHSRKAEMDESVKIPELKRFADDAGRGARGRGKGRGRGFRGRGRGYRSPKDSNEGSENGESRSVDNDGSFDSDVLGNGVAVEETPEVHEAMLKLDRLEIADQQGE